MKKLVINLYNQINYSRKNKEADKILRLKIKMKKRLKLSQKRSSLIMSSSLSDSDFNNKFESQKSIYTGNMV